MGFESFTNLEQAQAYYWFTYLVPLRDEIQREVNRKLLMTGDWALLEDSRRLVPFGSNGHA